MVQNRGMFSPCGRALVAGSGRRCPLRSTAAVLLALLAGACAGGEGGDVFPFPVSVFDLDNGLKVVAVEYDSPGIVAYYTVVRAGSRNEVEPGFSGYAHFFEHMMFRGTERYSTDAYNAVIKRMGADSNAFTTNDWTAYHFVASADALETIMEIESDRFLNLQYTEEDFRTEAGAILGEYNLNFSNPVALLQERLRARAFRFHPYGHTTLGLLEDIQAMPDNYDYSLEFYDRYYRPNNSIIVVVGDVDPAELERLAQQYYGAWEPGDYEPLIPVEPPQTRPRSDSVTWPNPTLPFLMIGYHSPAFNDQTIDMPALDVLSQLLFGETAPLYRQLYLEEQVVDAISGGALDSRDGGLFSIIARITDPERIDYVRDAIIAGIERFKTEPVDPEVLAATKSHMRYQFALGLDNPGGVARTLAHYLQLTADPETVNRVYRLYDAVTPDDIQHVAVTYFPETNRTDVTLTQAAPETDGEEAGQ
ncbi:MAG: insulinase family protein [Acidobacteria bacterium]|nr:insulinase family protein [Acidobacteriota bacterium]